MPLLPGEADLVASIACLCEGENIWPIWLQSPHEFKCVLMQACTHTPMWIVMSTQPQIAFRNPDKNNGPLGNLGCIWVRWLQGSHCLLRGAGISASTKELAKKLWHSHCRLSTLQPAVVHGQQKAGQIIFIRVFPWPVSHILNNLFYSFFSPQMTDKCRTYWYNSQKQSFVRPWEKVWSQVPGFSAE